MTTSENRLNTFSRVVAVAQRMGLIACIFAGTCLFHSVHANEHTIRPQRVLSVVTADWNDDGSFDRALLLESETVSDQTDLFVYLSEGIRGPMRLALRKTNIAWRGVMWGTQPTLEFTSKGSLAIISVNEGVGRNRWTETLTVVYRGNSLFVSGYTVTVRDILVPGSDSECDVNLLTSEGVKNGKFFKTSAKAVLLADWSSASIPQKCQRMIPAPALR